MTKHALMKAQEICIAASEQLTQVIRDLLAKVEESP